MEISISSVGVISEIQWGINEVASSLYVAKHIGSLLSRKTDSHFFNVLERDFNVKVKHVPAWLEDVVFPRRFGIRAQDFRRIDGDACMEDVEIQQLQGYASLIVLCCRYVLDEKSIAKMIEALLIGGLGGVENESLKRQGLPFTTKSLIAQFVRATVDSDKRSLQSQKATEWMSQLLSQSNSPWRSATSRLKSQQYQRLVQFMSVLFGGQTVEEEVNEQMARHGVHEDVSSHDSSAIATRRRVHDTMASDCAFAALAAAANGADIAVVCMCDDTEFQIPATARNPKMLVRFWMRQPPESVSKILQYSESTETATPMDSAESHLAAMPITIFGGQLELAQACCRQLGFNCSNENSLSLFQSGFQFGKKTRATIVLQRKDYHNQLMPKFGVEISKERISPSADQLSKLLQTALPDLGNLTRPIARLVDEHFKLTSYGQDFLPALRLVLISLTIGFLDGITRTDVDSRTSYAVRATALEIGGDMEAFMPMLMRHGSTVHKLIWTAAVLWGGAIRGHREQGTINEDIIGIVAPHCNILLDVIRDPLQFVRKGLQGNLLYMSRGSLPIIARSPISGFITAGHEARSFRQFVPESDSNDFHLVSASDAPSSDIAVTFEPDVNADLPFQSVFCCWYFGQLAFQISPYTVFAGLLTRGTESVDHFYQPGQAPHPQAVGILTAENTTVRNLSWMEILSLNHFTVNTGGFEDKSVVVARAFNRPGWLIALLGLSDPQHCVFQRSDQVLWNRTFLQKNDIVVLSG